MANGQCVMVNEIERRRHNLMLLALKRRPGIKPSLRRRRDAFPRTQRCGRIHSYAKMWVMTRMASCPTFLNPKRRTRWHLVPRYSSFLLRGTRWHLVPRYSSFLLRGTRWHLVPRFSSFLLRGTR